MFTYDNCNYLSTHNSQCIEFITLCRCTVKSPSQSAMDTLIAKGKGAKKPLVVAGCVPQGSRDIKELEGVSIVGVQQIDRVVEIVEETLKGHEVRLLSRKTLPALDLPKVRLLDLQFGVCILFVFDLVFLECYPFKHIFWFSSLLQKSVSVSPYIVN